MSVDWLNFKSYLAASGNNFLVYMDDEGKELPIGSEYDFQEAIRLAKLNKKRLKLILYQNKSDMQNTLIKNQHEYHETPPLNASLGAANVETVQKDSVSEEKCQDSGDIPPEWFIQYMKKFKKKLLHELKSSFCDAIQSAVEKEKKLLNHKRETSDLSYSKTEAASFAITSQNKKKKKGPEKDSGDFLDQRETKLAKKNEKLHPTKFERLEKLDNKTRFFLEERRRLLEKKRNLKQRFDKNYGIVPEKEKLKKSASFQKNEICICLPPNAEFVVTLNFTNDGLVPWEAPWLECFDFSGLYPKEIRFYLPRLQPKQSGFTVLRGRVSDREGLHHFKCRLFDGLKKIGPEFTCWAKVEINEPVKKIPKAVICCKESEVKKSENSLVGSLDCEKDEFTATQKKIEENINEIERRLQDIVLLRSSTPVVDNITNNETNWQVSEVVRDNDCDSSQNVEGKEKNWKETLEREGVYFGVDCLRLATSNNNQLNEQQDENGKVKKLEKLKKNDEVESSSDSELSVVFLSEEEENFILVPGHLNSPSPAESMNEDKKFGGTSSETRAQSPGQKPLESIKTETQENDEEVLNISEKRQRLPGPSAEVLKSKLRKINPSSTEYNFTTDNLTKPRFIPIPEKSWEERPSQFTFTGDKKEQKSPRGCMFEVQPSRRIPIRDNEGKSQSQNDIKHWSAPVTGNVYAVNSRGQCFLVDEHPGRIMADNVNLSFEKRQSKNFHGSESQNDRFSELPAANSSPISLINEASKIVSITKSALSNLLAVFAIGRKAEVGELPSEYIGKAEEFWNIMLFDMGFPDIELNSMMLRTHNSDMEKVVEDLLQIYGNGWE